MRPVIGIETDVEFSQSNGRPYSKCYLAYAERVWNAGGEPRLLHLELGLVTKFDQCGDCL